MSPLTRVHLQLHRPIGANARVAGDGANADVSTDSVEDEVARYGAVLLRAVEARRGDIGADPLEGDLGVIGERGGDDGADPGAAQGEHADDAADPGLGLSGLGHLEEPLSLADAEANAFEDLVGLFLAVGPQLELDPRGRAGAVAGTQLDLRARHPQCEVPARPDLVRDLLRADVGRHQPAALSARRASAASSAPISLRASRSRISRRCAD